MYDLLIIGGGVHGLAAAFAAASRGIKKVGLLEQFRIGHPFGSSHGDSRISRCVYPNPDYVALMREIHAEVWPRWERELDTRLFFPNPSCFFGHGPLFEKYQQTIEASQVAVDLMTPHDARKCFPQFSFFFGKIKF
jgi:sarcosine oxidase